jgi:hypothetical protein
MDCDQLLSKKELYETLISSLSQNTLGYKFIKSNNRHYYFQRDAMREDAKDIMTISVYFKSGYINCELRSTLYKHNSKDIFSDGILNRRTLLFNSKSTTKFGPEVWSYYFKKNEESLKSALNLILTDLDTKGREFVDDCDKRYFNSKFLSGLEFINNLITPKQDLINIFPKHFHGYWFKLNNDKYKELKSLFDSLDKNNQVEELKNKWENSIYAYEFFDKYVNG